MQEQEVQPVQGRQRCKVGSTGCTAPAEVELQQTVQFRIPPDSCQESKGAIWTLDE